MKLFSVNEAHHFCSLFHTSLGSSENSMKNFLNTQLQGKSHTLKEGQPLFFEFCDLSLRECERSLFLAISLHRRALEMMIPSASVWAYVTVYYATFFCAKSLLSMFGCIVEDKNVVDVNVGTPNKQELSFNKINKGQIKTTYTGSHKIFWDLFYKAVIQLKPQVTPSLAPCLEPVGSDPAWQIDRRNFYNYDTWNAIDLSYNFQTNFSENAFPASLPGNLRTQYRILEMLLELTVHFVRDFGVQTDALLKLNNSRSFDDRINQEIYQPDSPSLLTKSVICRLF